MYRKLATVIFLILFAMPVTPQNYNSNTKPYEPNRPKSKIRGQVIYEDNGKPVRRAEISLVRAEDMTTDYSSDTITDDNGNFELRGVRAGEYYFAIEVPGVLNPTNYQSFYKTGDRDSKVASARLEKFFKKIVTDGVNEAEVVIIAKRASAITGRVTYADGEPAPGVKVEALRRSRDSFETGNEDATSTKNVGTTTTDDRGFYRFAGLPPGDYIVFIREKAIHSVDAGYEGGIYGRDRSSELKTYYPNVSTSKDAKVLELIAGRQEEGIDISIPDRKLYKLSGVVLSKADKKPVKSARVSFERVEDADLLAFAARPYQRSIETDDQGKWSVKDLPDGNYRITVQPPYSYDRENDPREKKPLKLGTVSTELKITDIDPENMITEMPNDLGISGTVYVEGGKPLPTWMVIFALTKGDKPRYASTFVAGNDQLKKADFRIGEISPGEYNVFISLSGNGGFFLKSVKSGSKDLGETAISVNEGEDTTGIEIVLSDKVGILKGMIKADSDVFDFPRIALMPVSGSETGAPIATPDDTGAFEIKAAPGEYFVCVLKAGLKDESQEDWRKRITLDAPKITIKEGETSTITLKLPAK